MDNKIKSILSEALSTMELELDTINNEECLDTYGESLDDRANKIDRARKELDII